jgi:hypothetical protein
MFLSFFFFWAVTLSSVFPGVLSDGMLVAGREDGVAFLFLAPFDNLKSAEQKTNTLSQKDCYFKMVGHSNKITAIFPLRHGSFSPHLFSLFHITRFANCTTAPLCSVILRYVLSYFFFVFSFRSQSSCDILYGLLDLVCSHFSSCLFVALMLLFLFSSSLWDVSQVPTSLFNALDAPTHKPLKSFKLKAGIQCAVRVEGYACPSSFISCFLL